MKYCYKCGCQIQDEDVFCPKCGARQESASTITASNDEASSTPNINKTNETKENSTFYLIAFILCLIETITIGWLLIPLAWCIPMTVKIYRADKNHEKLSVGFSVCVLIFLNIISGILLLVADDLD